MTVGLFTASSAMAAQTIDGLSHALEEFKQQQDATYAPMTLARSQAYLGAAMLARDSRDVDEEKRALERSETTLKEAVASAARFRQNFAALIAMQQKVQNVLDVLTKHSAGDQGASPHLLMDDAMVMM